MAGIVRKRRGLTGGKTERQLDNEGSKKRTSLENVEQDRIRVVECREIGRRANEAMIIEGRLPNIHLRIYRENMTGVCKSMRI